MSGLITIFIISLSLSFDSFAVSVSSGFLKREILFRDAVKIAFSLAFFQAGMPLIGWFTGSQIKDYVVDFDHWIAFGLLFFIGMKMIYESLFGNSNEKETNPLDIIVLLTMSIATSIDALVVGFSFAFLDLPIFISVFIIGSVTFMVSMLGILFGKKSGNRFGKKMEIIGGLILIVIGFKILSEHLHWFL